MASNLPSYSEIDQNEFKHYVVGDPLIYFKGINNEYTNFPFCKINTSQFERPSKESTDNYHFYDLVLNNCSSWENFPKRVRSLIGSTSLATASLYAPGNVYVVVPVKARTILCPSDDIMSSFVNDETILLSDPNTISYPLQFNLECSTYFKQLGLSHEEIRALDYELLTWHLDHLKFSRKEDLSNTLRRIQECGSNADSLLSKLFCPEINGFTEVLGKLELTREHNGFEVFSSGEVVLCKMEIFEKLEVEIFN